MYRKLIMKYRYKKELQVFIFMKFNKVFEQDTAF